MTVERTALHIDIDIAVARRADVEIDKIGINAVVIDAAERFNTDAANIIVGAEESVIGVEESAVGLTNAAVGGDRQERISVAAFDIARQDHVAR